MTKNNELIDLSQAWLEWYETCELDKCSEQNIADLCYVSNHMFQKALKKIPSTQYSLLQLPSKTKSDPYAYRYAFHLMEAELFYSSCKTKADRQRRKGKIFENAKMPGNVTGYLLKSFFRSHVKTKANIADAKPECFWEKHNNDKEDAMVNDRLKHLPWQPHILTPEEEFFKKEICEYSKKYWEQLNEEEKAALYAVMNNITMSSPELLHKIGLRKTTFSELPVKLLLKVKDELKAKLANIDMTREYMEIFLLELKAHFQDWVAKSELGQWICEHFALAQNGKKRRFS